MLGRVNDIPIGSPPVPPGRHAAPGGWYPDPTAADRERYWDGWQWTRSTRPLEGAVTAPPVGAQHPGYGAYGTGPGLSARPGAPTIPGQAAGSTTQATVTADGVPLCGYGARIAAGIVDVIVFYLLASVLSAFLPSSLRNAADTFTQSTLDAMAAGQPITYTSAEISVIVWLTVFLLVLRLAYSIVFLGLWGATPGKLAARIRVIPYGRGTARRPGWRAAIMRSLVWLVPQISLLFGVITLIDALFPLWQKDRQALHDILARTQVIKVVRR